MSDDPQFDQWWTEHGQYVRAGGGQYEISFAFAAWQAARATPADHIPQARNAVIEECAKVCETYSGEVDSYNPRNRAASVAMIGALSCADRIRALTTPSDEETL